jgi:hypothetical protein
MQTWRQSHKHEHKSNPAEELLGLDSVCGGTLNMLWKFCGRGRWRWFDFFPMALISAHIPRSWNKMFDHSRPSLVELGRFRRCVVTCKSAFRSAVAMNQAHVLTACTATRPIATLYCAACIRAFKDDQRETVRSQILQTTQHCGCSFRMCIDTFRLAR